DVILNPLGVPSRMNLGQILETHLGWVAANGWYDDGTDAYKEAHNGGNGRVYVSTPVFDGATVEDVDSALVKWQEEHTRRLDMDIDTRRRPGTPAPGQLTPFHRRSRQPLDAPLTRRPPYL